MNGAVLKCLKRAEIFANSADVGGPAGCDHAIVLVVDAEGEDAADVVGGGKQDLVRGGHFAAFQNSFQIDKVVLQKGCPEVGFLCRLFLQKAFF